MKHDSRRPSPALVVSILALIVAMAGTAYAATKLPKNSVGSKQIKKNAVTTAKVRKQAITSAKIKLNSLKTVPSAQVANSVAEPEAAHLVGAVGEPAFEPGAFAMPAEGSPVNYPAPAFYKDREGFVHLEGVAIAGSGGPIPGAVFRLPVGYRPPQGQVRLIGPGITFGVVFGTNTGIEGKDFSGMIVGESGDPTFLDSIYRPGG
jgi:hypothetical protein